MPSLGRPSPPGVTSTMKALSTNRRASMSDFNDANRDPLTNEPGSHPVGTGVGAALGGAAAGAAAGAFGGPVGAAIGGVAAPTNNTALPTNLAGRRWAAMKAILRRWNPAWPMTGGRAIRTAWPGRMPAPPPAPPGNGYRALA